jgi:4-diphosphocytidyl-2C-methyl-D-erythritol kinase
MHIRTLQAEDAPRYRELAAALGASNDFFIRTTDPEHEAFVQGFVEKLKAADSPSPTWANLVALRNLRARVEGAFERWDEGSAAGADNEFGSEDEFEGRSAEDCDHYAIHGRWPAGTP